MGTLCLHASWAYYDYVQECYEALTDLNSPALSRTTALNTKTIAAVKRRLHLATLCLI